MRSLRGCSISMTSSASPFASRAALSGARPRAPFVVGVRPVRLHANQYTAGCNETGDVIDVAVGLLVGEALAQPDHTARAGVERENLFDFLLREVRVAVHVQKRLLHRQQCALTVTMDRAAFVKQRCVVHARTRRFRDTVANCASSSYG